EPAARRPARMAALVLTEVAAHLDGDADRVGSRRHHPGRRVPAAIAGRLAVAPVLLGSKGDEQAAGLDGAVRGDPQAAAHESIGKQKGPVELEMPVSTMAPLVPGDHL